MLYIPNMYDVLLKADHFIHADVAILNKTSLNMIKTKGDIF